MTRFRDIWTDADRFPAFWSGPLGSLYRLAFGLTFDQWVQKHWMRLRAAWPAFATEASIGEIGRDRRIALFDGETRASKEDRLRGWLSAHREAGLPIGQIHQGLPLWLPDRPTIRVVAGNSSRAMWCTLFGDDTAATLGGATSEELDDNRTVILNDVEGREYEVLVGRKPRFSRAEPTNFDWDSEYYADTAVSEVEPPTIHRLFYIVYKPDSIVFHDPDEPEDATVSLNSSMATQAVKNVGSCLEAWKRAGSFPWVFILAGDPASFDPTGSGVGYPDGSWWRAENRLDTARYELYHSPIGTE